ncbi:MAG: Ig-like domain repeat protein [Verrucomicrobia bacterium]|nr:Ig-like domain repeat protein [Verrucomicrobiota bacterium]
MKIPNPMNQIRKTLKHLALAAALGVGLGIGSSPAATPRSFTGTAITEDFDGLTSTGTDVSVLSGWDAGHFSSNPQQGTTGGNGLTTVTDPLVADDGNFGTGGTPILGNFGATSAADRALGSFARTTPAGDQFLQLAITNDTASPITSFELTYTGEEWRSSSTPVQQLTMWYSATDATNGFVSMGSGFTFNSPDNSGSGAIDGNAAGSRTVISGTFTPATPIAPGSTVYLRWYDINDSGIADDYLAIDDLSFGLAAPDAKMLTFGPGAVIGLPVGNAADISWTKPYGTTPTQLAALTPAFTLSPDAQCYSTDPNTDPDAVEIFSGHNFDFNVPVHYFVRSSDHAITNDYTVTVTVAPFGPPVAGYARWFDASQITGVSDGAPVTTWNDLSTNAANATVPGGNAAPIYVANAGMEAGLPALYFAKNGGAGNSAALSFTRDSSIQTVFSVFKGNSFLLTDADAYHFHRETDDSPTDPLWNGYTSGSITGGSTYVNGTLVNGLSYPMPTSLHNGFNLVEVLTNGGTVWADSFNKDRVYHAGNQYQAEVVIYDRVLSEDERLAVERYLMNKWLGVFYELAITLSSPTNNQGFPRGSDITATAAVHNGTAPFTVKFYLKTGAGAPALVDTQTSSDTTFTTNLGILASNDYAIYATVTDSAETPATATCEPGNAFIVASATATTTTVGTSLSPSIYGQSVTLTATVETVPTGGTVQFYDNGSPVGGPVTVNTGDGTASYSTSTLAAGSNPITAVYSGHGVFLGSTAAAMAQEVTPALLTVKADNKLRIPGVANPDLTYTITGYQNGQNLGTSGVDGAAALATSAGILSPVGSYDITCDVGSLTASNYSFTTVKGTLTIQVGAPPVSNGMVCWYDASSITVADGAQVDTWNDLSGNGHTATRTSGAPVVSYSDIKYNSSAAPKKGVHFRGTDDWFDCAGGMFVKEQYVVVRSPNPTWVGSGSFLARKSADFLSVRASSHNLYNGYTGFWDDQLPAAVSKNGAVVSSGAGSMPRGGFELNPITDYMILKIVVNNGASAANLAQYPYYHIGRTETLTGVEMDIAEIIGYEATLSAGDEAVLGSYLKGKYGLVATYPDPTPQAVLTSFSVGGVPAAIDQARRTITITTTIGTDVSALMPTFALSEGASCTVNGGLLESGSTPVNFTGLPVHCIVTSSDSQITADYTATIKWVSTLDTVITVLDVTDATGDGREILNDGTLVAANHVGTSTVAPVTLQNGLTFGISTAHLTGYGSGAWGGGGQSTNTDSNSAGAASQLTDATAPDYGKLMREYIWSSVTSSRMDIPGLVPGHTYRLQWITTSPRGGNISVEGSPSVALAPNSPLARVFAFTWVAVDTVANALVTRQAGSYPTDSEIVFNGYALHDMGVYLPAAVISGVTASQSLPVGTPTVNLSGTVSDGGTIYPAAGEAVSITINGVTEYAVVDGAGAFATEFPTASLAGGALYPITYGYAGNWITLASAPNDTSTALAISGPAVISNVTPNSTRVVGFPTVTLSGKVSNGGTGYPASGEPVNITVNGVTHIANISGSVGAFSLAFPMASIPVGDHPITYSYAGNGIMLSAAPDNTSTKLTVLATGGTAYESLVVASAPVSYWPLNETSGTTAFDLVGTNNITYGGTYTLNQEPLRNTDGQPCVLFTNATTAAGDSTGVAYNDSLNPSHFSVECWVKPTNTLVQYLVSLQDRTAGGRIGYALWKINGSAGFGIMAGTGTGSNGVAVNGATAAEAGKTYHVVGTYDGTTLKLYVNGNLEGSAAMVYVPATAAQPGFTIGSRNGNTPTPSHIQDVALYNRALTQQEILTHYQGASTSGYAGWAATYANGQAANLDFNHDGVSNGIAYFMGETGRATNPGVVNGKVRWKKAVSDPYAVKVSTDLQTWSTAPGGSVVEVGGYVEFTLPTSGTIQFGRLEVTIP